MVERSQLGQVPIPGGSPAGEALSGDDDFDKLRAEVSRDPVLGVPVDWKSVADLSQTLLAERSKDFAVASYLAVGLVHNDGLVGLRDGLRVMLDLFQHFWETAFPPIPKRMRGRINALSFLSERTASAVAEIEPKLADAECVNECGEILEEIERLSGELCGDHEIPLGDITRALRELTSRVPTPAAPEPVAGAGSASTGSSAPGFAASTEFNSRSDIDSLMRRVSTFLKENDARDPLGYRLPRIVDFGELDSEPPDEGGELLIPGPDASQLSGMRSLWAASDWLGLVETADNVCRASPLCLDAHRYCSEGLAGLGGPYQAAADGIRDEVKSLLKRAPRLVRLRFSDGTPLADPETQQWLQDESTGAEPTATVASDIDPEELNAARTEARELARKGDLPAALARLGQTLAGDPSPRGRFLGRLELAELCAGTGHDRVALPMLAELDDTLHQHGLDAWEPALSRRLLELYYQCSKRRVAEDSQTEESEKAQAESDKLYERLCRIDPVAAAVLE